jgi:hypothetical protein
LRKHIAKALQARSQAIRTAIERHNKAAATLRPSQPKLSWDQVVEYAFLADFDLLRDTREDIRRPWAQPANRVLMDQYFKIQRAHEEIDHLNIEIKRIITHIQDERAYLVSVEAKVQSEDPVLAHQIALYRAERTQFYSLRNSHRFPALLETSQQGRPRRENSQDR